MDAKEKAKYVESLPLTSIVDGWPLRDGSLYLIVDCPDGVQRTFTVKKGWKKT